MLEQDDNKDASYHKAKLREELSALGLDYTLTPFSNNTKSRDFRLYWDEAVIWGPTVKTPDLHEAECDERDNCYCLGDGKWCFQPSRLSISLNNTKWEFVPVPHAVVQIECVRDNEGSAAWNQLGSPGRFSVDVRTPQEIKAWAYTSSREIYIRIGCLARYYGVPEFFHH